MRNTIIQGDALTIARSLPDESVNCIVTSPPYWGLRDYGTGEWVGGSGECDHSYIKGGNGPLSNKQISNSGTQKYSFTDTCPKCGAIREDTQLGLEDTPEGYIAKLTELFRELRRALRADGTCWLNLGDSYNGKQLVGIPWRVALALQADGWYIRSDIIWAKPNPMPESITDRPTKGHEYIFLLAKSERYWYDMEAVKEEAAENTQKKDKYIRTGNNKSKPFDKYINHRNPNTSEYGDSSNGRNKRTVWTVAKPVMKLRDDLTEDQKCYVLERLFQCGLI